MILAASEQGRKRLRQLESRWFPKLVPVIEKLMMPGIMLHYALRKRYIEDFTRNCIQDGISQVINLGAGLDTLAYRLGNQYPDINFVEVDHPATHMVKKHALQHYDKGCENFTLLSTDFTSQRLEEILTESSLVDKSRSTLCIVEGVLMYLDQAQACDLLESLKMFSLAGLRIIFTAAKPPALCARSYGVLLKIYLKIKGEPFNWVCESEKMDKFLAAIGFRTERIVTSPEFRKRYLESKYSGILHEGEYIVVAESL